MIVGASQDWLPADIVLCKSLLQLSQAAGIVACPQEAKSTIHKGGLANPRTSHLMLLLLLLQDNVTGRD